MNAVKCEWMNEYENTYHDLSEYVADLCTPGSVTSEDVESVQNMMHHLLRASEALNEEKNKST